MKVRAGSFFMSYYNQISGGYEELHKEEQFAKLRLIQGNLVVPSHVRVLDVGCGPGWSAEFFENVVGVDPAIYPNTVVPVIHAPAEKLPFGDHSFDIILCVTAIHHFDLDKALNEMVRVAKPRAVFVITVLKKSPRCAEIVRTLLRHFTLEKELEGVQDVIYFLRRARA
jgi:ubiquinone/menaquinone biosynthesis C-methylase UbiE